MNLALIASRYHLVYTAPMKNLTNSNLRPDEVEQLKALNEKTDAEKNPQKPFKPQRIDLTPEQPVNIGYVGGVRLPKTKK